MNERGLILLSALLVSLLSQFSTACNESTIVRGLVQEETGKPIPNANVIAFLGPYGSYTRKVLEGKTDSNGTFILELPTGSNYSIFVYYDDPVTPGFDYVPSSKAIRTNCREMNLTFQLLDGASVFLVGEVLFVEATELSPPTFSVLCPETLEVFRFDGYELEFGNSTNFPNRYLGLNPEFIIVPAGVPFIIKVNSEARAGEELHHWYRGEEPISLSFTIDKPGHFLLKKGEAISLNLTEFSVRNALSTVKREISDVSLIIKEREEKGFYVTLERQKLARINSLVSEAEILLNQSYESSFSKLREAHTEITNLMEWLNKMYVEALRSIFLLIPFLAFTSAVTSSIFFEDLKPKLCLTSVSYTIMLLSLFYLYPGSRMVAPSLLLECSLASLIIVLALFATLPMLLKGREFGGRVPLRNLMIPIFSIAKRNLRRRKLRSVLTLLSVTILVSSFIVLTSFTTGYGLTFSKISRTGPSTGILVRTLKPPIMEARAPVSGGIGVSWFTPLKNSSIVWFESRPYVRLVAPKYENKPHREYKYRGSYDPLGYVDGLPVFGIVGIVPSAEAKILSLDEAVTEGRYLRDDDENCVLISERFKERLGLSIGNNLTLWVSGEKLTLRVVGIFDDRKLENIRDLDGEPFLPMKIVELRRAQVDEGIDIITEGLRPCSASEVLVTTWKTASKIPEVQISRLDIVLKEGEDLKELAKMIALNKGLRAWASTREGIYLAKLSPYFEGKGLPIAIPWLIVVLNVVITMLNSLYERRKEILIYSSIGINPSQIAGIFLAEAGVIGIVGGGLGYLLGLCWYRILSLIGASLQVKQKISALWTLAAMAVSLTAVLVGGLTALKGSVVITPSLRRKWRVDSSSYRIAEPFKLTLPILVFKEEVDEFVDFFLEELRSHVDDCEHIYILGERREGVDKLFSWEIEFFYTYGGQMSPVHTRNKLLLRKERGKDYYEAVLLSDGIPEAVQRTASFVRRILLKWNVRRGKLKRSSLKSGV